VRPQLLSRDSNELDCWNPLTRSTTRDSLSQPPAGSSTN
jgi:hypothetical protein